MPLTVGKLYDRSVQFAETKTDFEGDGGGSKGACRALDYKLPDSSRIFVLHMLGEESRDNLGYYYLLTYYLFPRKVDISVGQPARFITGPPPKRIGHYAGTQARSTDELEALGYDIVVDITATNASQQFLFLKPPSAGPKKQQLHPYTGDAIKAFLLPLLVAIFGASVVKLLFPKLYPTIGWGEKAATGLATGVLIVGQTAFGLRLLGVPAEFAIWCLLLAWTIYVVVRRIVVLSKGDRPLLPPALHPAILGLIPLAVLFFVLLRLAGQLSLMEFDAVASWAFKSKVIFHSKGSGLIEHFSNPSWAHAHFDYPTLVPSLYTLTYGAIGRVNEFVTKYWPCWMLFFAIVGVLSACRWPQRNTVLGLALAIGLAFMPFSLDYVLQEGATIPMFFFLTLGNIQIACAITDNSRERLGLGILILAGAAMCKFEGVIVLALWIALLLFYKRTRLFLIPNWGFLSVISLIFVLFIPYLILRFRTPLLTPESNWVKFLIESPLQVLANFPKALFALLATQSLDGEFAKWTSSDNTTILWNGQWAGFKSLLNETTLGFVWVGVVLSALLYRLRVHRKPVILFGGVLILFASALGIVLSALPETLNNLNVLLNYCYKSTAGRFLAPVICAWVTGLAILIARSTWQTSVEDGAMLVKPRK